jgi:membrane protein DedA with SNARE-associated domain
MNIESVLLNITSLSPELIYFILFISNALESIFPPWPTDVINLAGGMLSGTGRVHFALVFVSSLLGNLLGAIVMYKAGHQILRWMHQSKYLSRYDFTSVGSMHKANLWMRKGGFIFVLFSRFFAGIRFFVSILAGMTKMPFALFIISYTLGAAIWTALLTFVGFTLGQNWRKALEWMNTYNKIFLILLFVLLVFLVVKWKLKKRS